MPMPFERGCYNVEGCTACGDHLYMILPSHPLVLVWITASLSLSARVCRSKSFLLHLGQLMLPTCHKYNNVPILHTMSHRPLDCSLAIHRHAEYDDWRA